MAFPVDPCWKSWEILNAGYILNLARNWNLSWNYMVHQQLGMRFISYMWHFLNGIISNYIATWNVFSSAASKPQVYFLFGHVLANSYIILKFHQVDKIFRIFLQFSPCSFCFPIFWTPFIKFIFREWYSDRALYETVLFCVFLNETRCCFSREKQSAHFVIIFLKSSSLFQARWNWCGWEGLSLWNSKNSWNSNASDNYIWI